MRVSSLLAAALAPTLIYANISPVDEASTLDTRDDFSVAGVPRDLEGRSIWDTIWNDIKGAATCTACQASWLPPHPPFSYPPRFDLFLTKRMQAVLLLLKGVAEFGDSYFTTVLTEICKLSGVRTYSSLSH